MVANFTYLFITRIGNLIYYLNWKSYLSAGHCWRSRDELIIDILLWTPTYGWAKAGRPARTYIQQLCEDTGCSPEDLPEAMNDREKWRERVRDIRASGTTWWWFIPWIGDLIYHLNFISFLSLELKIFFINQNIWREINLFPFDISFISFISL